jgi:peptidoglycan/xylan/chitin deacetylase (PgdA/CDA1 family)
MKHWIAWAAIAGILLLSVWGLRRNRESVSCPALPPAPVHAQTTAEIKPPRPPRVPAEVISHGLRTVKKVALTFDACSTSKPTGYDERITRVLVETGTPATVFLGGKWIEDHESAAKQLASLPLLELGNHTYLHPHLTKVSDGQIREELRQTQQELFKVTGRTATLFRPPYGEYDDRVVKIAAELGLTTIEYDLASGDPDVHFTKQKLIEYVTSAARSGSIVVMHINGRGWHTAEALPDIILALRKRGFRLVTVGELLRDRASVNKMD